MKQMNLLPEDLRPRCDRRRYDRLAFRMLLGVALLFTVGYAYLTVENTRLEKFIAAECARIDTLIPAAGFASEAVISGADTPDPADDQRPLMPELVAPLDGCVPPEVALTELRFGGETGALTGVQPILAPPPQTVEISGVSTSGRAIGYFLTALRGAGSYTDVELESLHRREDGEFAFTVLGRLSL